MPKIEILQIGLTENCNLLCRHCPRDKKILGNFLTYNQIDQMLKQFNPSDFEWLLISDFGEVSTIKNLIEILRLIRKRGFNSVMTVTNMQAFKKESIFEIVKEELMHRIYISLESAKREKYEYIRIGSSYDRFLGNINLLKESKKKFNKKRPVLVFNVVCMKSNLEDLPGIVELANNCGINKITFVNLNSIANIKKESLVYNNKLNTEEEHLSSCDKKLISNIFNIVEKKAEKYNIELEIPPNIKSNSNKRENKLVACTQPYQWIQLSTEGEVYPCCQISRKVSFGNIFRNNFSEIWNSGEYVKFRKGLLDGSPSKWCRECNMLNGYGF